jgi:ankyrin repeat protein
MNTNEEFFDAAESGDLEEVKELIKDGIDINLQDEYGNTPLELEDEDGMLILEFDEKSNVLEIINFLKEKMR